MRRAFLKQTATAAAAIAAPSAFAQSGTFPDRPIRIIVSFAPGGSVDPIIRIVQPKMAELLGQPLVIENRPGGSTSIACMAVKNSPPDGHTLLFTAGTTHATHTIGRPQFQYDPIRDFTPVANVSRSGWALVVHNTVPVKTVAEYVAYCKANPNKLSFASAGIGSGNHLAMERFNHAAGIKLVHVPYKAGAAGTVDLLAGRVQAQFTSTSTLQNGINAGTLRALAYTATRQGETPAHLTFTANGFPEFESVDSFNPLIGPANMPAPVLARLNSVIERTLNMADVKAAMIAQQQYAYYQNSQQLGARLRTDHELYAKLIKDANINMSS